MTRPILSIALAACCLGFVSGCAEERQPGSAATDRPAGEMIIFHAGSLAVPFGDIAAAFNEEYPDVKVAREAAGSRSCARKVSDLGMPCDVMASADYTVIEELLFPQHAGWVVKFATNEMAIVYTARSRLAERINQDNWHEILTREDIHIGRSDPNTDPCGYRAILTAKLAEEHWALPGLAGRLLGKDRQYIRPKETDLIALLELGEVDYIFLYRSVAEQHGLEYLRLPEQVNLSSPRLTELYAKASVRISGATPHSFITKTGAPMVYGVTIPENAPNAPAAVAFLEFLLDEDKGLAIMRKHGQGTMAPAAAGELGRMPPRLAKLLWGTK